MPASFGPKRAWVALSLLVGACSVYEPELIEAAASGGSGGEGEGGSSAGTTPSGGAAAGKAGSPATGGSGASAGAAVSGGMGAGGTPAGEPYLLGDLDDSANVVVLSTEGGSDWMHWGQPGPTDVNRKANVPSQLLEFKNHGATSPVAYVGGAIFYSWNNGTPLQAATTHAGIAWEGEGEGVELKIPAVAEERVARVHLGVRGGTARFSASLSEPGVAAYEQAIEGAADGWYVGTITLEYGLVEASTATLAIGFFLETATEADAAVSLTALSIDTK
jgi:hypothetical protein